MKKLSKNVICMLLAAAMIMPQGAVFAADNAEVVDGANEAPEIITTEITETEQQETADEGAAAIMLSATERTVTATGECGDNLAWTLYEDGELVISGEGEMWDWEWDSDMPWYDYHSQIKTVTIESGVTSIGNYAFYECSLTSVDIPDSVTSIGESAFDYCDSLTSVSIGNGVASIDSWAFAACNSLTSVYITDIKAWCEIEFCNGPSNPLYYAENLYLNEKLITELNIPEGVTSIGDRAFYSCDGLTSVTIPDSVTSIGKSAFWDCASLTSVAIGNSVTSIGDQAFLYCGSLTSIFVDENNANYSSNEDGVLFNKDKTTLIQYPAGNTIATYVIPDGVTSIGDYAFFYCNSLTSVTIPDSVTSIGKSAFLDCDSLMSVAIGNSVTSIGDQAFTYCDRLTSVTIPDSVTIIGESAFMHCASLTSVTIGNGVTSIGEGAFRHCSKLTSATIYSRDAEFGSNVFYDTATNFTIHAYAGSTAETYASENGHNFVALEELERPVTATGECGDNLMWTLYDDGELVISGEGEIMYRSRPWDPYKSQVVTVVIEEGVTSVPNFAFTNYGSITSVSFPNTLTSIGSSAFNANSLTRVTIPESVTSIGSSPFRACHKLTEITVSEGNPNYTSDEYGVLFDKNKTVLMQYPSGNSRTSYVIPDSVKSIDDSAMSFCGLENITIPDSVTSIGNQAFRNCYSLTSVAIPDSVTSIGELAFANCYSLTSVAIPESVTSVAMNAFLECSSLTSATIYSRNAEFGGDVFAGAPSDFTIYAYAGSAAEAYASENGHNFVAFVEEPDRTAMQVGDTIVIPNDTTDNWTGVTLFENSVEYQRMLVKGKTAGLKPITLYAPNSSDPLLNTDSPYYRVTLDMRITPTGDVNLPDGIDSSKIDNGGKKVRLRFADKADASTANRKDISLAIPDSFEGGPISYNIAKTSIPKLKSLYIQPQGQTNEDCYATWDIRGIKVEKVAKKDSTSGDVIYTWGAYAATPDWSPITNGGYQTDVYKNPNLPGFCFEAGVTSSDTATYDVADIILLPGVYELSGDFWTDAGTVALGAKAGTLAFDAAVDVDATKAEKTLTLTVAQKTTLSELVLNWTKDVASTATKLNFTDLKFECIELIDLITTLDGTSGTATYDIEDATLLPGVYQFTFNAWTDAGTVELGAKADSVAFDATVDVNATKAQKALTLTVTQKTTLSELVLNWTKDAASTATKLNFTDLKFECIELIDLITTLDGTSGTATYDLGNATLLPGVYQLSGNFWTDAGTVELGAKAADIAMTVGTTAATATEITAGKTEVVFTLTLNEEITLSELAFDWTKAAGSTATKLNLDSLVFSCIELLDEEETEVDLKKWTQIASNDSIAFWTSDYGTVVADGSGNYVTTRLRGGGYGFQAITLYDPESPETALCEKDETYTYTIKVRQSADEFYENDELVSEARMRVWVSNNSSSYSGADTSKRKLFTLTDTFQEYSASFALDDKLDFSRKLYFKITTNGGNSDYTYWDFQGIKIEDSNGKIVFALGCYDATIKPSEWTFPVYNSKQIPNTNNSQIALTADLWADSTFTYDASRKDIALAPGSYVVSGEFKSEYGEQSLVLSASAANDESASAEATTVTTEFSTHEVVLTVTEPTKLADISIALGSGASVYVRNLCIKSEIIATGSCGDNLTWTLYHGGRFVISGTGAMTDRETPIDLVSWYGYNSDVKHIIIEPGVTTIGDYAFGYFDNLVSVDIADTVTSIGLGAFYDCENLISIDIPEGVTTIGDDAFWACTSLESVSIPTSVTSIGNYAFYNCTSLTGIDIPEGVTNIGNYTFYNCVSLADLGIPESVTSIGRSAFYGCVKLTDVTIFADVTAIGDKAFYNCSALTSAMIYSRNVTFGTSVFYNTSADFTMYGYAGSTAETYASESGYNFVAISIIATGECGDNLTWTLYDDGELVISGEGKITYRSRPWDPYKSQVVTVIIEEGVTSVPGFAFANYSSITSVSFPNTLTSIGNSAFNANSLTRVTIPESVTSIGSSPFRACHKLTEITVSEGNPNYTSDEYGVLFDKNKTVLIQYPAGNSRTSYVIPDSVKTIGDCAFGWCDFKNVTVPESVTSIGEWAFASCLKLTSVDIPEGVTSIGERAFASCTKLTSVDIPEGVTSIGDEAFASCRSLTSVTVDVNNTEYSSDEYGVLFNKDKTTLIQYPIGNQRTEYTIPGSVTSIGDEAFEYCSSLTSITVDVNNTEYSSDEYGVLFNKDKTALIQYPIGNQRAEYIIPGSVMSIGSDAFYGSSNLTSIAIPEGVTSIGDYAFEYCSSLTKATIYSRNAIFGLSVFYGTPTNFTIHAYAGSTAEAYASENGHKFVELEEPERTVTATGECGDNLTWTLYDDGELVISGEGAMWDWRGIDAPWHDYIDQILKVAVESGVTSISQYAFKNCDNLLSVSISDSVTSIFGYTFYSYQSKLMKFTVDENNPNYSNDEYGVLFNKDKTTLIKYPTGNSRTAYSIPASVTTIGDYAFAGSGKLSSAEIPEGVTTIGDHAFAHIAIRNVHIPESVTSIGDYAFSDSALSIVTIPDSVTSIGDGAFYSCHGLTSVVIPKNVASIGTRVFASCTRLTSIAVDENNPYYLNDERGVLFNKDKTTLVQYPVGNTSETYEISEGTESIASGAFEGCEVLATLVIPESVTDIAAMALRACDSLTGIAVNENNAHYSNDEYGVLFNKDKTTLIKYPTGNSRTSYDIPEGVAAIGHFAFMSGKSLTSINIPQGVTSIGQEAFRFCNILTNVELPDSVTTIGQSAFANCTSLISVNIPDGVTNIGARVFSLCNSLTSATIYSRDAELGEDVFAGTPSDFTIHAYAGSTAEAYVSENGHNFVVIEEPERIVTASGECGDNLTWTLYEDGELVISGEGAMWDWGWDSYAPWYNYRSQIKTVTIESGVTSIGDYAFRDCNSLTSVDIPDSVTSIGRYAFYFCDSLTSIDIPDSVTSIGEHAFSGCDSLTSVYITDIKAWCEIYFANITSNPLYYANKLYLDGELISGHLVIPEGTESIGDFAFCYCSSLTSVDIPDSVTSIGRYAFYFCDSLTSVDIPDSVTSIGRYAFYFCDSLTSVIIGDSVTSIGSSTFFDCYGLTSITVDENNANYSSDEYGVLFNKDKTTLILYPSGNVRTTYRIPEGVTSIEEYAFADCSSLTSVDIPDSVTSIGYMAFHYCGSLTSVIIGDSVTLIDEYAFYNCSALTSATIYSHNATFGSYVFSGAASGFTIYGYAGSTAETYASENRHTFVALPDTVDITDAITSTMTTPESATVTAPTGGWVKGKNTFSVSADLVCFVLVSNDGGKTYDRVTATVNADGSYSFTANLTAASSITVAIAGDSNGDDKFTNADATRLKAHLGGKVSLGAKEEICADASNGGGLSNADVTRIKAALGGKRALDW